MKKAKKALASLAIVGMALTMIPFNAFAEGVAANRIGGATAAQTAVSIADQTGWTGTAILASSTSYGMVDALTAGPLATFLKAPILLTGAGNVLDADTKAGLIKLNVTKVYVTSGTAVISQAVVDVLKGMGITVESLAGVDRFTTSANIAQKMVSLGATVSKVAVAYGWLNQDALSIASIASAQTEPILLTERDTIPASVKAFLSANASVTATDLIGGTAVISDVVKAQLPSATRYYGDTAYDTNIAVLKQFDNVLKYEYVLVANGETAIDALAGAPLAAKYNAGIVLTDGSENEDTTYVSSKLSPTSIVTALGGTAVVPDGVLNRILKGRAANPATPATPGSGGSGGSGGGGVNEGGGSSSTANLNQVVTKIMSYRGYLNQNEKDSINEARTKLTAAVQEGALTDAAEGLMTDQVVSAFKAKGVTRAEVKAKIIEALEGFREINYSSDANDLKQALNDFERNNLDTFNILFPGIKVNEFYGFALAMQEELKNVIEDELIADYENGNISALSDLVNSSGTELKEKLIGWTKTATTNVIKKSAYQVFDEKLADNGWNIDMLVKAQRQVGAVIDPANAAEKAMAMSVIRSQIVIKINGTTCTTDSLEPYTLANNDNTPVLSVEGINTYGFNLASMLVWASSNPLIATVAQDGSKIQGLTTGTAVITASRNGNELVKFTVKVE